MSTLLKVKILTKILTEHAFVNVASYIASQTIFVSRNNEESILLLVRILLATLVCVLSLILCDLLTL